MYRLKPDGWSWIVPWSGAPKKAELTAQDKRSVLALQADLFRQFGFSGYDLDENLAKRYGVTGAVENNALFLRGLPIPDALRSCTRL